MGPEEARGRAADGNARDFCHPPLRKQNQAAQEMPKRPRPRPRQPSDSGLSCLPSEMPALAG